MSQRYGKDYGIKVDVPWYIKCPIINRIPDTCLVMVSLTTFTADGAPLIGVADEFRIPIVKTSLDIRSIVGLSFALPEHEGAINSGKGLYCTITLLDVNHKEVLSITENIPLQTSFWPYSKDRVVSFGHWRELCLDLKFGDEDWYYL